jgi:hypothetical protein
MPLSFSRNQSLTVSRGTVVNRVPVVPVAVEDVLVNGVAFLSVERLSELIRQPV